MPPASAPCAHSRLAAILWFDPRRVHSSIPTATRQAAAHRTCQGWPRLPRTPKGLGLDRPEHAGMLDRIGYGGRRYLPQSRDAPLTRPCRLCAPTNPPKNIGLRNVGTLSPKGNSNRWNSMKSTPLVTTSGREFEAGKAFRSRLRQSYGLPARDSRVAIRRGKS